jgi:UDP-N-acetylmuramyl pentapeptide phosphotransferase/UDP-N-acetylglucosamine-1-phosphate transferase
MLVISILWIAGMTNAYNFMDGIDGLAAIQAVTGAGAWAFAGWFMGRPDVTAVGVLIGCASLGFLAHNWHPARLFMGDVGSAFLGYSLAVLTVIAAAERPVALLAGAVVLWPFVFDPIYTILRRAVRRENLLVAHRSHLYQRLVATGWTHRMVSLLYGAIALGGAVLGVALVRGAVWAQAAALVFAPATVLLVRALVRSRELARTPPVVIRPGP